MEGMEAIVDAGVETIESTPVETTEVVEQPGAETDVITAPEGTDPTVEATDEEVSQDGRTLPKHLQQALKNLKEVDPKAAADLRKHFFSSGAYSKVFPTPAAAQSAKAALDLAGGPEGLAKLQSQVSAIELVDASFEKGDTAVIDDVSADFPDGFKKLVPYAIEKLEQLDAASYAKALQPHVYRALEGAGLGDVLGAMQQALQANQPEQLKQLVAQTLAWLDKQKQQSVQRNQGPDPERQKFDEERQQFQQEKERAFRGDIGRQTIAYQNQQMERNLNPYLKGKNLSQDAKVDLADGINREISRLLKANTTYQSQVKAMLSAKTRDPQAIVRYINSAVDEAVPKAVKSVWTRRYGAVPVARPGVQKPATGNTNVTTGGPIKIPNKPNREDVDWTKDPKRLLFTTSKAYMRSGPWKGKLVSWA